MFMLILVIPVLFIVGVLGVIWLLTVLAAPLWVVVGLVCVVAAFLLFIEVS